MTEPAAPVAVSIAPPELEPRVERADTRRHPWRELLLVLGMYAAYSLARLAATGDLDVARAVASDIRVFEAGLGIGFESTWNAWIAGSPSLMLAASLWYASLHWAATVGMLVFLWLRRPHRYRPLFAVLVGTTLIALVFFILVPTAPPRLTDGFVDVLKVAGNLGYWDAGSQGSDGLSSSTNELAAFPSLHAGWSMWVCMAMFSATRSPWWRAVGVAYALTTASVVILTGNHWVVDVLAGWAIVALCAWAVRTWMRARRERSARRLSATVSP